MPNPSGSSCVGINFCLQAHLVLEESPVCPAGRCVLTLISVPWFVRSGSVSAWISGLRDGFRVDRAGVAQLVEHLICNQRVGGSNPFASSTEKQAGRRDLNRVELAGERTFLNAGPVLAVIPLRCMLRKAGDFPDGA